MHIHDLNTYLTFCKLCKIVVIILDKQIGYTFLHYVCLVKHNVLCTSFMHSAIICI